MDSELMDFSTGLDDLGLDDLIGFNSNDSETEVDDMDFLVSDVPMPKEPVEEVKNVKPNDDLLDFNMETKEPVEKMKVETNDDLFDFNFNIETSESIEKTDSAEHVDLLDIGMETVKNDEMEIKTLEHSSNEDFFDFDTETKAPVEEIKSTDTVDSFDIGMETIKNTEIYMSTKEEPKRIEQVQEMKMKSKKVGGHSVQTNWDTHYLEQLQVMVNQTERSLETDQQLRRLCLMNGYIPHHFRRRVWKRILQVMDTESIDLSEQILTTSLDLPNQLELRSELLVTVQTLMAESDAPANIVQDYHTKPGEESTCFLRFERLLTYFCKSRSILYPLGLCHAISPLLLIAVDEERESDLFYLLYGFASQLLPHITVGIPNDAIQSYRQDKMKLLLMYHEPDLAFHLETNCPTWYRTVEQAGCIDSSLLISLLESVIPDVSYRLIVIDRMVLHDPILPCYAMFFTLAMLLQQSPTLRILTDHMEIYNCMTDCLTLPSQLCRLADATDHLISQTPVSVLHSIADVSNALDEINCTYGPHEHTYFSVTVQVWEVLPFIISGRRNPLSKEKVRK